MKTLQYFSDEYLEQCKKMTPLQIVQFLEGFRLMTSAQSVKTPVKLKPICIKMPEDLLQNIKKRAKKQGVPYQSLIKSILQKELGN